jgi:glycosyltransferase involved in cell wall biosynthesis
MAKVYGIEDKVIFYKNISDEMRSELLKNAICVLYTPHNEHFGIVPIETMYCRSIVICDESGGPKESIIDS